MSEVQPITLVIAEDHPLFRRGLTDALTGDPTFRVVGEAADGEVALELVRRLRPQVVLLDVDMPRLTGLAVADAVRREALGALVVMLTMYKDAAMLHRALDAGAKGYVLKDCAVTDIVSAIRAVAAGQHYTSPSLTSYLVGARRSSPDRTTGGPGIESLTPTERKVLALIAEYKTSKQIAEELFVSPKTVQAHRANICVKLDVHGSDALMRFALEHRSKL